VKQIHAARHAVEAHLIRGYLHSHGIAAEVRGEYLTSGWGELPVDVCSVWIVDESEYDAANALVIALLRGTHEAGPSAQRWHCRTCGEELEEQFTACWACGTAKA
jgi:Putative prokaryotic signal transducing protein